MRVRLHASRRVLVRRANRPSSATLAEFGREHGGQSPRGRAPYLLSSGLPRTCRGRNSLSLPTSRARRRAWPRWALGPRRMNPDWCAPTPRPRRARATAPGQPPSPPWWVTLRRSARAPSDCAHPLPCRAPGSRCRGALAAALAEFGCVHGGQSPQSGAPYLLPSGLPMTCRGRISRSRPASSVRWLLAASSPTNGYMLSGPKSRLRRLVSRSKWHQRQPNATARPCAPMPRSLLSQTSVLTTLSRCQLPRPPWDHGQLLPSARIRSDKFGQTDRRRLAQFCCWNQSEM